MSRTAAIIFSVVGGALLVIVGLPLIAALFLVHIMAVDETGGIAGVQQSLDAVGYNTLPGYQVDSGGAYTDTSTSHFGTSYEAYAHVSYTDESVLKIARTRLEKAGWTCHDLRAVLPVRAHALAAYGTDKVDSSCVKPGEDAVDISLAAPNLVSIDLAAGDDEFSAAISDEDYCSGIASDGTPDPYLCAKVSPEYAQRLKDYQVACAGWKFDPSSDDWCNVIVQGESQPSPTTSTPPRD